MDKVLARVTAAQRSRLFPDADALPSPNPLLRQKDAAGTSATIQQSPFIASAHFCGSRPEYAFQNGPQGMGYYREGSPTQPTSPTVQRNGSGPAPDGSGPNGSAAQGKQRRQGKRKGAGKDASGNLHGEDGMPSAVDAGESSGDEDGGLAGAMAPMKGAEMTQRELVAQAFAGDDVEADFQQVSFPDLAETSAR